MKKPALALTLAGIFALVTAVCTPDAAAVPPSSETLQKVFDAGVAAYGRDDFETAEKNFRYLLQYVPQHPQSRRYLVEIERKRKAEANLPPMQKALSKIIIPEMKADEMSLEDALIFFKQKANELSKGKVVPNFVFRPGTPDMTDREVTIQLSKLPMSELLRHIGVVTDTRFAFEPYAIVVTPAKSEGSDAATQAALDAAAKKSENP